VVESTNGRLAVECDGDRFHPIEKVADDMARQAVLERSGWRFVRIRGSQFFRNPDAAMNDVFETLFELGILPEGNLEPAQPAQTTSDLVERVRTRASELLRHRDEALADEKARQAEA
jgi:hypothetical protein